MPTLVDDWPAVLDDVLAAPHRLRPLFQPIVDLERGTVAGFELLSRFDGDPRIGAQAWFDAARTHGVSGPLEAIGVRAALAARRRLAPGVFLTVNVSPLALLSDEVGDAFAAADRLDALVVEVTEQSEADLPALRDALDALRERGARVAVDDAGTGYAGLGRISALRPQFVKVDRGLVSHLDVDGGKVAVVEALSELAGRLGASLVAEGVERHEELDALLAMRVPFGQGWAFGRPAPALGGVVDPLLADRIRTRTAVPAPAGGVGALVEPVPTLPEPASPAALDVLFARRPGPDVVVLVDREGRATGLVRRTDHARGLPPRRSLLVVDGHLPVGSVARRAMARAPAHRFDPALCADPSGRHVGLLRLERVVDALTRPSSA
jgi:EAL domain-containing protein (putative c-di-GMP-specific phosphodiesterase class I)